MRRWRLPGRERHNWRRGECLAAAVFVVALEPMRRICGCCRGAICHCRIYDLDTTFHLPLRENMSLGNFATSKAFVGPNPMDITNATQQMEKCV